MTWVRPCVRKARTDKKAPCCAGRNYRRDLRKRRYAQIMAPYFACKPITPCVKASLFLAAKKCPPFLSLRPILIGKISSFCFVVIHLSWSDPKTRDSMWVGFARRNHAHARRNGFALQDRQKNRRRRDG